ncbi:MAG: hypothetical protein B7Z61_06155 [Acidobacteria bacterium 37-71-11]|nr:MAG: hypothetical protein B7Z61_06155 [Acidobacteria bacterium 37-71-11]
MDYPIWNLAMGGGVLIGIVAITHVLVSHFAVGGGLAIAVIETLAVRRRNPALRALAKRSSLMLILVSTVFGAISGVGIWVTIGLVQPAATSALIHNYVWGWAAEWGFFILEVVTALLYYATWDKVRPRTHLVIIWLYAFAAYMSLVIIQGILSFMLTPGRWLETHSFWDGIFNPSYLPGLVLRTGICLFLAGAYLTLAALRESDRQARVPMIRLLAGFQIAGILLAYGGYRWWEHVLPGSVRAIFLGANPLLARKPFVIRDFMFSNGILISEIQDLDQRGVLAKAVWAARGSDASQEAKGRAVFRAECASCHTIDGYLSIRKLVAPVDPDMLNGILGTMREEGNEYVTGTYTHQGHVATDKLDYPLMPPLVGTAAEQEALAAYLLTLKPSHVAEASHAN